MLARKLIGAGGQGGESVTPLTDITTLSYSSDSMATTSLGSRGLAFTADGLTCYIMNLTAGDDSVLQYDLSTPWDLSTGSYTSTSGALAEGSSFEDIFLRPDTETTLYLTDGVSDTIYQYTLTAGDITTLSYASKSYTITSGATQPKGIVLSPNGEALFVVCSGTDAVHQYTLSTAWDISTASYDSKSFSIASEEANPQALTANSDGSCFFVVGAGTDTIYQYNLSTPWDASTASYASKSLSVLSEEGGARGLFLDPSNTRMFLIGATNDTVFKYT